MNSFRYDEIYKDIIWPAVLGIRREHRNIGKNKLWKDSHWISKRMCFWVKERIKKLVSEKNYHIHIQYLNIEDGYLRHNPRISSQMWKQRHSILVAQINDVNYYIDPFADIISLMITEIITEYEVYEEYPWYFYPDTHNPEFSEWNKCIRKMLKKFDPVGFFQYKVWAFISDQIHFTQDKKSRRQKKK